MSTLTTFMQAVNYAKTLEKTGFFAEDLPKMRKQLINLEVAYSTLESSNSLSYGQKIAYQNSQWTLSEAMNTVKL